MPYPEAEAQPHFARLEETVLDYWRADGIFEASVERRPPGTRGDNEYVFYDGPPFANGLPHYGHLLTGFVKDAVPRYQTMRGRRVERRFGWDCHGLPAEVEAERLLGVSGRRDILQLGIERFNATCRASVLQFTEEWERYVSRQARWVDFRNDYKTLDLTYMESVMWAFKSLWDKGLVYEGYRVLAYCWRCETPLSNTETRMDDVYLDRQDLAVTVWFELETGERLLAWTTTPWTLPANLALAVDPDVDYAVFEESGQRVVLAAARAAAYEAELAGATRVGTVKGHELVGRAYAPLFPFFAEQPNAFRVLAADFVTVDEGTGIVHLAPGFGEDDQTVCAEHGVDVVCPMDSAGRYTAEVAPWEGQHVFDANAAVAAALSASGHVVRRETYVHPYPHCWRCARPLVYRAVSSWFVQVTAVRDRMVELNEQIQWVPAHIQEGSFGKWLEHARDWTISRNRFWGSPIPVWRSDDPRYPRVDVYGSVADLERDFGVALDDLHRPAIDALTRPNPDDPTGASTMRRVEEVLDCWFESGSMPFAQVHYPFENREWFEHHYPGDFIVEYIGQTRGWFYTLHVLATALFDRPAFRTCMAHGIVLGSDGQKMSKNLKNYPDPFAMFDTYGADAMRWFLLASPIVRGGDLVVTEQGVRDAVNQVLRPLWNAWSFFSLYANADGYTARQRTDQTAVLDRYLLAKLRELVDTVTERMDVYDLSAACGAIRAFLDALTNWYIRRSRDRFWAGTTDGGQESADAFDTLYTALVALVQVSAPLLPLVGEHVYRGLTGERSVHLTDWPDASVLPADSALVAGMDRARETCSAALSIRKASGRRVRQPLATLTVAVDHPDALAPFADLIAEEVNVKEVALTSDFHVLGTYVLDVTPSVLGPRLGPDTQKVIRAVRAGDWTEVDGSVTAGGVALEPGEFSTRWVPRSGADSVSLPGNAGIVQLDTTVTPELEAEGTARDLVRAVQQARRDAGLHVSDRVRVRVMAAPAVVAAVESHVDLVAREVLAVHVELVPDAAVDDGRFAVEVVRQ
jgi:isoleucyl-tRNA synthetase